jgi:hypothetical protein
MSRVLIAVALLGAISLSIPAFAAQDCLAYCQMEESHYHPLVRHRPLAHNSH